MVDTDRLDDEYILFVKWLFVKESFRNRGVATSLLGGLLGKSQVLRDNNVLFEIPANKELIQPYYKPFWKNGAEKSGHAGQNKTNEICV